MAASWWSSHDAAAGSPGSFHSMIWCSSKDEKAPRPGAEDSVIGGSGRYRPCPRGAAQTGDDVPLKYIAFVPALARAIAARRGRRCPVIQLETRFALPGPQRGGCREPRVFRRQQGCIHQRRREPCEADRMAVEQVGVRTSPGQQASTSTPLGRSSFHRPSARTRT